MDAELSIHLYVAQERRLRGVLSRNGVSPAGDPQPLVRRSEKALDGIRRRSGVPIPKENTAALHEL
jgi:hypothetical protein